MVTPDICIFHLYYKVNDIIIYHLLIIEIKFNVSLISFYEN